MSLIKPHSLEELIISLLRSGETTTTALLEKVREIRGATTKQGFYHALRRLRQGEVVAANKKIVSLHSAWIGEMRDEIAHIAETYMVHPETFGVLNLAEKESLSYICGSALHLDSFWGHTQAVIANAAPRGEPVFAYDPHYWFYLIRSKVEYRYYQEFSRGDHQFLMCVGGTHPLDHLIKKDFTTDMVQYHLASLGTKNTYYPSVIGEFCIEVTLDAQVASKVEDIYEQHTTITDELIRELTDVLQSKSRNRIKITRDAHKAEQLRKKLSKYFYIKK